MKPTIKNVVMPVAAFAIAIVGAFASNIDTKADPNDRDGYREINNICTNTNIACSLTENVQMCKDGTHNLYLWESDTQCVLPLFKKVAN